MQGTKTKPTMDVDTLRQAIGHETRSSDDASLSRCQQLLAVMDGDPDNLKCGDPAPLGLHWCINLENAPMADIDNDGHPRRGGFLPDVPLPRRMWAGGNLRLHDAILVGDRVEQTSRIADVRVKEGRSGTLCFVTVENTVATQRGVAISETKDIVYRGESRPNPAVNPPAAEARTAELREEIFASPVLLFRYSALTFNAHRIHYDHDYAQQEEGYPGLVVQGPLQATLLLNLAAAQNGTPESFQFRGLSPLFDGAAFSLNAASTEAGMDLWTASATGGTAMQAKAGWA